MTSTNGLEVGMSGLSVVLQPTQLSNGSIPLNTWLSQPDCSPIWIPLTRRNGVTKAMPVLAQPHLYPSLMQSICQEIALGKTVQWQEQAYELTGVEVDPHALHIIHLSLAPEEPLPPTMGRAVHALCFKWLKSADATLAETLHHQENLPFTLSLKPSSSNQWRLRISILRRELLAPLLWGLSEDLGNPVELVRTPCHIGRTVEVVQATSFQNLLQLPAQETIDLQLLSPTSFKQGKEIQPFPLPELVFNSLLRRWNAFAPQELCFPAIEWRGLVSAYELKTHAFKLKGGAEIGGQGLVRYRFPEPEQAKIATALAHFARFSGVGRKTAMGMGQAQLLESR